MAQYHGERRGGDDGEADSRRAAERGRHSLATQLRRTAMVLLHVEGRRHREVASALQLLRISILAGGGRGIRREACSRQSADDRTARRSSAYVIGIHRQLHFFR